MLDYLCSLALLLLHQIMWHFLKVKPIGFCQSSLGPKCSSTSQLRLRGLLLSQQKLCRLNFVKFKLKLKTVWMSLKVGRILSRISWKNKSAHFFVKRLAWIVLWISHHLTRKKNQWEEIPWFNLRKCCTFGSKGGLAEDNEGAEVV